jgi:cell division protein FtsB
MARESTAERRERERAERERQQRFRRGVLLMLGVAWLFFGVWAVIGPGGFLDVLRVEAECDRLQQELRLSERSNKQLHRRIASLTDDPAAIERLAREMLDYQAPGEIVYLLPDEESGED